MVECVFARVDRFLKHYLRCKSGAPHSTSACILVPANSDAQWRNLLSGMTMLGKCEKGCMLYAEAGCEGNRTALGPSPWDVEIWFNPPAAEMQVRAMAQMSMNVVSGFERFTMSMPAFVEGHALCTLFDSGATHDYIDSAFVAKCGIKQYSTGGRVSCTGGKSVSVTNYVLGRVISYVQELCDVLAGLGGHLVLQVGLLHPSSPRSPGQNTPQAAVVPLHQAASTLEHSARVTMAMLEELLHLEVPSSHLDSLIHKV